MCAGSPTVGTSSSSQSPPDNEFETDKRNGECETINRAALAIDRGVAVEEREDSSVPCISISDPEESRVLEPPHQLETDETIATLPTSSHIKFLREFHQRIRRTRTIPGQQEFAHAEDSLRALEATVRDKVSS